MGQDVVGADDGGAAPVQQAGQVPVQALGQTQGVARQVPAGIQLVLPQGPEEGGVPGLMDGFLYGVPFTTNTWYMYYDKRVFSEEDAGSLDAMLEKGAVSFPFTSSWYLPAFCFGNGCTLFDCGSVLGVA